ncbi:probable beta-1,4-xylosyltransferase IRX10L [Tanacetum coccineum]
MKINKLIMHSRTDVDFVEQLVDEDGIFKNLPYYLLVIPAIAVAVYFVGYYVLGARAAVWENFKDNALFDISTEHPTTYYETIDGFVPSNIDLDDLRRMFPFPARNVQHLSFGKHWQQKSWKHTPLLDFLFLICYPRYIKAYYRSPSSKNYWYKQMVRIMEKKMCDLKDIEIKNLGDGKWDTLTNSWRNSHFLFELPWRSSYDEGIAYNSDEENDYDSDEFKLNCAGDVLEDDPVGRLKVCIYELPSKYDKKILQRDPRCLNHMFAAEIYMHRFLVSSHVITLNPEEADWFYTPVYTTEPEQQFGKISKTMLSLTSELNIQQHVPSLDTNLTSTDIILRKQRLLANPLVKQAMLFPHPAQPGDAFHQILNGLA